jgi:hypothetical protein
MGHDNFPLPQHYLRADFSFQELVSYLPHGVTRNLVRFWGDAFSAVRDLWGGDSNAYSRCPDWRV